jgi:hypothetical protein
VHGHVASRWRKLIMLKCSTWTNEPLCRSSGTVNTAEASRYWQSPHGCGRHYGTSRFVRIRPMKQWTAVTIACNQWRHTGESQLVPLFCVIKLWNANITERVAVTAYFCLHTPTVDRNYCHPGKLLDTWEYSANLTVEAVYILDFWLRQPSVIRHSHATVYRQKFLYSEH